MKLRKGLTETVLLGRIGLFARMAGVGERGLAFYLLDLDRRGLFRKLGFSSTTQLALMRFQVPLRKTRELLCVAHALDELPLIDEAFATGTISWSAVHEISRVAIPETEKEWLDLAAKSSLRKIESAVQRTRRGERPPQDPYGLPRTKLKVVAELAIEDHALWQAAFDRVAANSGDELDASTVLLVLARSYLEKPLNRQEAQARQAFQVVYHRCTDCERAWVQAEDGIAGIPAAKVAAREPVAQVVRVSKDAQVVRVSKDALVVRVPGDARDTRILPVAKKAAGDGVNSARRHDPRGSSRSAGLVPKRLRDRPNTPAIRQQVLGRDGMRCRVPGCSNRARLASHHVVWRSHGGATEIDNEVGVCQSCHGLIHEGLLRVTGKASTGLEWLGRDGDALSTFDGGGGRVRLIYGRDWSGNDPRGSLEENDIIHSLDEVPGEVDSEWWTRFGNNFEIRGTRLKLKRGQ